ncbi:MAG: hypothetical protein PHU01_08560, partial [Desulfuromonadaceae bacterium]|nr:hypothetical protein [Desulfuromonadaceae bacterium]
MNRNRGKLQVIEDDMTDVPENHKTTDNYAGSDGIKTLIKELEGEINRLHRFSVRGIQAVALFLIVSTLAWLDFSFLPATESVTSYLGDPPSARIISVVLLFYT